MYLSATYKAAYIALKEYGLVNDKGMLYACLTIHMKAHN